MKKKINNVALVSSIIAMFLSIKTMDIKYIAFTVFCFVVGIMTID